MTLEQETERLSQVKIFEKLNQKYTTEDMITVYLHDKTKLHNYDIYCALIPSNKAERVLSQPGWDLPHGNGFPGAVINYENEVKTVRYCRFGDDSGIEPLVIDRDFYGIRNDYKELSEEFRLFHKLYHDKKSDQYFKIRDDGEEELVVVVETNRIQIRLKEIRQFLAIKEMYLSIQFDCREYSEYLLQELGLSIGGKDQRKGLMCWGFNYGEFECVSGKRSFSRLIGLKLVQPLSKAKSGFWGFAEENKKEYVDYIIDINEDGDTISHTCDPETLGNYFGANPGAPQYLTPVCFDKQVLEKYYQQPSKYSVEDSVLRCAYLWSIYIDNHHNDKVYVWLGDLGRYLSYEEQLHWKSYNISPRGHISKTFFKRQILAQFADSECVEHLFQQRYHDLQQKCEENLGWQLLLPLTPADEHYFQCLRIPARNEQKDFDELILALTKILIDSLNEEELNKYLSSDRRGDIKGSISRLEIVLNVLGADDASNHIAFLRKLQNLRSSSTAHRKGNNFKKVASEFGLGNNTIRDVFTEIFKKALAVLDYMVDLVGNGRLYRIDNDVLETRE